MSSQMVKVTCLHAYQEDGAVLMFKGRCWTDPDIAERAVKEGHAIYGWQEEEQGKGATP